jgi:hypothetical protein
MGDAIRSACATVGSHARAVTAWGASFAAALAIAIGMAGCGGSDEPGYCADRAALEQSLADLGEVDVRADGLDALTQQLRVVQRDASALVTSTREEFGPEASALRSAIAQLEGSARAALADPSAELVSAVAADASSVASAFGELSDAVSADC